MPSLLRYVSVFAVLAVATAQGPGVILKAQGTAGSPASYGLQVSLTDPDDANIMDTEELKPNLFNECGRTLKAGNLDSGGTTEDVLALKAVTAVTKGSKVAVTVNQGGDKGAGPYTCDLDPTSNSFTSKQQTAIPVTDKAASAPGMLDFDVNLPNNLTCVGGSPGNVCLLRCFNTQHYGGCIAIQQTDVTPTVNTPTNIKTASTVEAINQQISDNQKDLKTTIQAERMGTDDTMKAKMVADAMLVAHKFNTTGAGAPNTEAPGAAAAAVKAAAPAAAAPAAAPAKGKGKKKGKGGAAADTPAAAAAPAAAPAAKVATPAKVAMTNPVAVAALIQVAEMGMQANGGVASKPNQPQAQLQSTPDAEVTAMIAAADAAAMANTAAVGGAAPAAAAAPKVRAIRGSSIARAAN